MNSKPAGSSARVFGAWVSALGVVAGSLLFASCESGGGGGGPSGKSTIQGTVVSFSSGGAFYVPAPRPGLLAQALDLLVPNASAAVGGVSVRVRGTDLEGSTDDTGFFIISGVPGGRHSLDFTMGSATAGLDVDVPDNSTVTLNDVRVSDDSVSSGSIKAEVHEEDDDSVDREDSNSTDSVDSESTDENSDDNDDEDSENEGDEDEDENENEDIEDD